MRFASSFKRIFHSIPKRSNHKLFFQLTTCAVVSLYLHASIASSNGESFHVSDKLMSSSLDNAKSKEDDFKSNKLRCIEEIKQVINDDTRVDTSIEECAMRGKPWNSYHKIENNPDAVVYPLTTNEVSEVLKICNKYKIPVIPFGGGTSIEGHTLAPQGGISLDFSNMKNIVSFHPEDLDMVVQAGVGYVELNEYLKPHGLWFPLDPGPGASVGGMCACRCSGSTALRYGSMRENVLNVTAVLPDGTIFKTGSRARKSSAGYDITRLMIGSEGTLAVITEVTLKLHPIPSHSHVLKVCFPTLKNATEAATGAIQAGITLGRAELMDDTMISIINQTNSDMTPWPTMTTMLFEVTGASLQSVQEQMDILLALTRQCHGEQETRISDVEEGKKLWLLRKQCLWAAMSQYPDKEAMITDACVPLSKLPDIMEATRQRIDSSSLPCPMLAHAGDGNFHVLIMFKPDDLEEKKEAKALADFMSTTAITLGGTCTGEHGIGSGKKNHLRHEMGEGSMKLMEMIKSSLDPNNIMNPDKIIDMNRIC